jgi:hypothetical protein
MKKRSKRKSSSRNKKPAHRGPVNHPVFQLLVNSLNDTRDEDRLVRVLQYSQIQ